MPPVGHFSFLPRSQPTWSWELAKSPCHAPSLASGLVDKGVWGGIGAHTPGMKPPAGLCLAWGVGRGSLKWKLYSSCLSWELGQSPGHASFQLMCQLKRECGRVGEMAPPCLALDSQTDCAWHGQGQPAVGALLPPPELGVKLISQLRRGWDQEY